MITFTILEILSSALLLINVVQYARYGHRRNLYGTIISAICTIASIIIGSIVADNNLVLPFP
jgi:predicted membrane chloride channel (bestrophin family)